GLAGCSDGDGIDGARARVIAQRNRRVLRGGDEADGNGDVAVGGRRGAGGDAAAPDGICKPTKGRTVNPACLAVETISCAAVANGVCTAAESRAVLAARHGVGTIGRTVEAAGMGEESDRSGEVVARF